MLEYEAVMTRPEHLEAAGLSDGDVQDILDAIASIAEPVRLAYLWRPSVPDPQDDMVLETAVNGRAEVLVTLNRRHFDAGGFDACARSRLASRGDRSIEETEMKKSNFVLRLQLSLMEEARKVAKAEVIAVNQLINVAVAEKVSALRTEEYFADRAATGDVRKALRVLRRAGAGNSPLAGDELPKKQSR